MVGQTHPDTLKEKEDEKFMKLIMGLPISKFHPPHSHDHLSFEITTTTVNTTLIPRIMRTKIIVCPIRIDLDMDYSNGLRPSNIRHDIRGNGGTRDMSLHKAASDGDAAGAKEAVRNRRELLWLIESKEGNLPLHFAVLKGHKEVATYLVQEFSEGSYALNRFGISPLYLAVHRKDLDLVEYMFCKLAKDNNVFTCLKQGKSIIRVAIGDNNQEMLKTILKHQPGLIKCTDEEGLTPLSFAASKGFIDIASYILKKYPKSTREPNKDKSKSYPIHKACLGGHVEVIKMLHAKLPESLHDRNRYGQTIMHLAAKERGNKLKSVVSYLLELNEGILRELLMKTDENGNTPLKLAIINGNGDVEDVINRIMPL